MTEQGPIIADRTPIFALFGAVLAGFVVEGLGLIPTILGMGAVYLAVTIGMFLNPALRHMDASKER